MGRQDPPAEEKAVCLGNGYPKNTRKTIKYEMSDVRNIVPQAGRTECPESRPINMMGCPTDSEGGKHTTGEGPASGQAGLSTEGTGFEEDYRDPFARRDSINRSPPMLRTGSLGSLDLAGDRIAKRKRGENGKDDTVSDVRDKNDITNVISGVCKYIRELEVTLKNMYKPKTEIVKISLKLALEAEKLVNVVEISNSTNTNERERALREENETLRHQIACMKRSHTDETVGSAGSETKCASCLEESKKELRRKAILKDDSYETFKELTEDDWRDDIFPKLKVETKDIRTAAEGCAIVLPCGEDLTTPFVEVDKVIKGIGGKEHLVEQGKKKGKVAMLILSMGFPDQTGTVVKKTRDIYYPIVSDGKGGDTIDEVSFVGALRELKAQITVSTCKRLAFPLIVGADGNRVIRMLRFMFTGTEIEVILYKDKDTYAQRTRLKSSQVDAERDKAKPTQRRLRQNALLVSMPNTKYEDILKTVKQAINPGELGVEVQEVRKTNGGDLLLSVGAGAEKMEALRKNIEKSVPSAKTRELVDKTVLHIKELEATSTAEEIKKAILEIASIDPGGVEVGSIRPAFGGKLNATVLMPTKEAKKLVDLGKIKVGWTKCRILERQKNTKCFKCWEHGHTRQQCTGPDRQLLCLKCGNEGHKAAECKNDAFCVICKKKGHQTGSNNCQNNGGQKQRIGRKEQILSSSK